METWEKEGAKHGRVINKTNNEKSFWEPTFVPWGLESDDLIELHRRFYREFYLRPVTLARHMEQVQTWRDVAKYIQGASLFSFLFFNKERPSLGMVKELVVGMSKQAQAAK